MLSLTSLRCFVAAAEERNFTRAASRLFISQQALSNHISKLEAYYGVRLFDRGTPLTLTDAGRALQRRAAEILSSVDDCAREVQDIKNFRQGELTIGIPVTRGTIMLPPLLSAFHQMFPQIQLHLAECSFSENITDVLYDGTADLCIGYEPEDTKALAVIPLFEEKFVLLAPNQLLKEHYPGRRLPEGPLSIACFADLPFVAQKAETMNGQVFQTLCRGAGIAPDIVVSTQNLITQPQGHAAVQPGGAGADVCLSAGLQRYRPLSDLRVPPEKQAAHPGRPGIYPACPGYFQRRQRRSNTDSISFRVFPIKESISSSRG